MTAPHWMDPRSEYDSLVALLDERAETHGEAEFCTFPDGERTFASLAERSRELAAGLAEAGVEAGGHVAMLLYNRPAFLDVYFAAARLGAVTAPPLNVSLRGDDLEYTLTNADPVAVVVDPDCREHYDEVADGVAIDTEITLTETAGYDHLETFYRPGDEVDSIAATQADPLVTIYTSGTVVFR